MIQHRRLTTALFVAFILSGGFTYLLSRKMDHQAAIQRIQTVRYVASNRAIQSGELLKASDLRMTDWPAGSPVRGGFQRIEDAVGRAALYPLDPGQPLLDRALTASGAGPGLASRIPNGMRAIALRTDEVVGVAGFLTPGSHLDVLVTYRPERSSEPLTATVLQNAEVVAAGHQAEPDPEGKASNATVVTLLLNPEQAERAVLASTQGAVHFVLRNSSDTGTIQSRPINLSELTGASPQPVIESHALGPPSRRTSSLNATVPHLEVETILGDQAETAKVAERSQP